MTHSPIDIKFGTEDQGAAHTIRASDIKYTKALNSILTTKSTTFVLLRLSQLIQLCAREGHFDWSIHIINHYVPKLTDRIALLMHLRDNALGTYQRYEAEYYRKNSEPLLLQLKHYLEISTPNETQHTTVLLFKAFRNLNAIKQAFAAVNSLSDEMPDKLLFLTELENRARILLQKEDPDNPLMNLAYVNQKVKAAIYRIEVARSHLSSET